MPNIKAADLLLEIGTEELPPKALRSLKDSFASGIVEGLQQSRITFGNVKSFASPRRLAVLVADVATAQEDREVTQKGPPVAIAFDDAGNATKAGLAFAKKCGVDSGDLGRQKNAGGEWLSYTAIEPGRSAAEIVPQLVQQSLDALPIPRRMRWGATEVEFVRPVHWLVMLHGSTVIDGSVLGIKATNKSRGHRFHAPGDIKISAAGDYAELLQTKGYVVADFDIRRALIVAGVEAAAKKAGGIPVGSDGLFDEVAALTEWPVPLTGRFDEAFLALPREVIVATLTGHQRYFPVQGTDGDLMPAFVTVANIESTEPERVRAGNERVILPRLADATFFWNADRQVTLATRVASLANVVYQKGLGSLQEKAARVRDIAVRLAKYTSADENLVSRAAELAKCDLLTGMVGEFPELQGTMGEYYANNDGEDEAVATAIGEQYLPRFAGDQLPASAAGRVVAIADKLDTLAGIFALGKKPSGNRDPFALRRAALGAIRIIVESELDLDLVDAIADAVARQPVDSIDASEVASQLYDFFIDRLRSYSLDQDADLSAEMFASVRARQPRSMLDFTRRLTAVKLFMQLEEAGSLAAANKRTANMLNQAGAKPAATVESLLSEAAEIALHVALKKAQADVQPLIEDHSYTQALQRLSTLREPVDTFFDEVMVMAEDETVRNNRLALLAEVRGLFLDIADISRLTAVQD
jgi:glycyl-tRNA synthetase beta chain